MATPNLNLPTTPAGATNISIAYNDAMKIIDAVNPLIVIDITVAAPPTTVSGDAGKRWIVAGSATGTWAGHENEIALCTDADVWFFIPPIVGWRLYNLADGIYYRWNGTTWVDDTAAGAIGEAPSDGKMYGRQSEAWAEILANMVGAASSTDNALARFDGTGGKTVQDSGVIVSDDNELSGFRGKITRQTGTSYTLLASDAGGIVELENASLITLTLPNDLPKGFCCTVVQIGAGQVSFSAASGGTLTNRSSHSASAGAGAFCGVYVSTNTGTDAAWMLGGDTA